MIQNWCADDKEVILMMDDFNDNVYEGNLAKTLVVSADICLTEQFRRLYDQDTPFSHITDTLSISAVFASP